MDQPTPDRPEHVTPGAPRPTAPPDAAQTTPADDAPPPVADAGLSARGWLNQNWPSLAIIVGLLGLFPQLAG